MVASDVAGAAGLLTGAAPSLSGKDPIAHILWLKEERPEVYDAASLTKVMATSVAIMQLVERGKIGLDTPVLREITVRMLLNMTSGLADYRVLAFPSLLEGSAQSLEDNRFRHFYPSELIKLGVDAPAVAGEVEAVERRHVRADEPLVVVPEGRQRARRHRQLHHLIPASGGIAGPVVTRPRSVPGGGIGVGRAALGVHVGPPLSRVRLLAANHDRSPSGVRS